MYIYVHVGIDITESLRCTAQINRTLWIDYTSIKKKRNCSFHHDTSLTCCCCLVMSSVWFFCDPVGCDPPGSSVHSISQARILEQEASPGDFPNPGIEPGSPTLHSLLTELTGKPLNSLTREQIHIPYTARQFLTTGPPGKSQCEVFYHHVLVLSMWIFTYFSEETLTYLINLCCSQRLLSYK